MAIRILRRTARTGQLTLVAAATGFALLALATPAFATPSHARHGELGHNPAAHDCRAERAAQRADEPGDRRCRRQAGCPRRRPDRRDRCRGRVCEAALVAHQHLHRRVRRQLQLQPHRRPAQQQLGGRVRRHADHVVDDVGASHRHAHQGDGCEGARRQRPRRVPTPCSRTRPRSKLRSSSSRPRSPPIRRSTRRC